MRERRILIVEDEWLIADYLAQRLGDSGYAIAGPAATVAQALRILEATPVDVAILDVSLRKEESYPVADQLKLKGIPFLFCTGFASQQLKDAYGTVPCVQKPADFASLVRLIEAILLR